MLYGVSPLFVSSCSSLITGEGKESGVERFNLIVFGWDLREDAEV